MVDLCQADVRWLQKRGSQVRATLGGSACSKPAHFPTKPLRHGDVAAWLADCRQSMWTADATQTRHMYRFVGNYLYTQTIWDLTNLSPIAGMVHCCPPLPRPS